MKSRPHHPQTCGKIERFWKTLWEELLSRTVCADFADCERRIRLFIQHYNFQRPHQALEGATPAEGLRMPSNLPPLTPEQMLLVRQWIAEGAQQ